DATFVDAPVLGTRAPAQRGELVVLGSGPESARPAVDPQVFFDAVRGGSLDLPYARLKGPAMVNRSFGDVSFSLSPAPTDTELVLAAADEAGLDLPAMRGALARLAAAEADGHGDEDMAATYWGTRRNHFRRAPWASATPPPAGRR
ncbi:MAG: NAD-binding protein, partial [Trebonia sp.]